MRVVITGIGVQSPIGCSVAEFHDGIKKGNSGINLIEDFDTSDLTSKIAGQVKEFDPLAYFNKKELKSLDRFSQLGLAAAYQAYDDARINSIKTPVKDICVYLGTGIGGITAYEEAFENLKESNKRMTSGAYIIPRIMNNAAASKIAKTFGMKGANYTFNTACSSGSNAIGQAFREIRNGGQQVILCGGTEAPITRGLMKAWCNMHVLSRDNDHPQSACRPFDLNRNGFVLAEGAAIFILESLHSALERGANIYSEVLGFSSNCNAGHITFPDIEGQTSAILSAIKDSEIAIENIDYINAHGTATKVNDRLETETIKSVFGDYAYRLRLSSTKSMIGHAMGASSALELLATILAVKNDFLPPTINYQTPDSECDLDIVPNESRDCEVNIALSNSFAFGGNNSILVIKKWMPN